MKANTLPRDYAELCIKNADSMYEQMKARGLYNGKSVELPYKGKTISIPIPTEYPIKILAAIAQLGDPAKKKESMESFHDLDKMAQLLLEVNGVEYVPDLLIEKSDLAKLMGQDEAKPKKAKGPARKKS